MAFLFDEKEFRSKLHTVVSKSVRGYRVEIRKTIKESQPQGKTYQRQGFRHRASRRGQPPAEVSGDLVNTLDARMTSEFSGEVKATQPYAARLENELDRKFIEPSAESYEDQFFDNIRRALK